MSTLDARKNFAITTVSTGYDDAAVSIDLSTGKGARFPDPATDGEFNLVWWNSSDYPQAADDPNREIVRCTARSGDTLTITRAQEGTTATTKNTVGKTYMVQLGPTKKTIDDIEAVFESPTNAVAFGGYGTGEDGVSFYAVESGVIGNSISLVFDGVDDVDTVVNAWNASNPSNTVGHDGIGTEVLNAATVTLHGGGTAYIKNGEVVTGVVNGVGLTIDDAVASTFNGVANTPDLAPYPWMLYASSGFSTLAQVYARSDQTAIAHKIASAESAFSVQGGVARVDATDSFKIKIGSYEWNWIQQPPSLGSLVADADGNIYVMDLTDTSAAYGAVARTTSALPACVYDNGADNDGVGATLTASSNGAFPQIDGVTINQGNKLLVMDQSSTFEQGIYELTDPGSPSSPWILTRPTGIVG